MFKQISDARESTLTIAAVIRLDSGVGRRMGDQTFSVGKSFVALVTLVWSFSRVHSDVHLELALVEEARSAEITQMALGSGVLNHVRIQRGQRKIALVTLPALVLLVHAAVRLDVDLEL